MKKFKVPYVRIEHQVTFFEVEAEDEIQAEEMVREIRTSLESYEVVYAEEFIQDIEEIK
jgi:RNase P/RNase MRP subunit POP5